MIASHDVRHASTRPSWCNRHKVSCHDILEACICQLVRGWIQYELVFTLCSELMRADLAS